MHRSRIVGWVMLAVVVVTACARVQPHVSLPEVALGEPFFLPRAAGFLAIQIEPACPRRAEHNLPPIGRPAWETIAISARREVMNAG